MSYGAPCDNNKRLETFYYCRKVLHPRRPSNPMSDSMSMKYLVSKYAMKKRKTAKTNRTSGVDILENQ